MRRMAGCASLAQGFVFKDRHFRLFTMTLRAALIHSRVSQSPTRFENVRTMRVMALHAIHLSFQHRMMLRQVELRVSIHMATQACVGIFAWIHDERAPTTRFYMQAP